MQTTTALDVLRTLAGASGLILAREARRVGLERELRTEMERGNVIRLRRDAYVAAAEWQLLSPGARRLLAVRAHAAAADEPPVFSHFSAAAVWGFAVLQHLADQHPCGDGSGPRWSLQFRSEPPPAAGAPGGGAT